MAVLRIQSWWRVVCARRELSIRRELSVRQIAVIRLQIAYRRFCWKRSQLSHLRHVLTEHRQAAVKLQCAWRRVMARHRINRSGPPERMVYSFVHPGGVYTPSCVVSPPTLLAREAGNDCLRNSWLMSRRMCSRTSSPRPVSPSSQSQEVSWEISVAPERLVPTAEQASPSHPSPSISPQSTSRSPLQSLPRRCPSPWNFKLDQGLSAKPLPASNFVAAIQQLPSWIQQTATSRSDADAIILELMRCGLLSCDRRTHCSEGKCDLEAVTDMLLNSQPEISVCFVARVECGFASAAYSAVSHALGPERLLWHGTSWQSVANIARNGFNRAYAFRGRHGSRLGHGVYFAEDPHYALRFCARGASRPLLLAGVLPGRICKGVDGLIEPPFIDNSGIRYNSTADNAANPRVLCVFKDFQALPRYLAMVS